MPVSNQPFFLSTIADSHNLLDLPKPEFPLLSIINFNDIKVIANVPSGTVIHNFYVMAIQTGMDGKIRYGQNYYHFRQESVMTFLAPGQVVEPIQQHPESGWLIYVHADFFRGNPVAKKLRNFDFFSYDANEALLLDEAETDLVRTVIDLIRKEQSRSDEVHSKQIILAYFDALLSYADRFYHKQFLRPFHPDPDVTGQLEKHLDNYYREGLNNLDGLPTVQYLARMMNFSPGYLSDLLRTITGKNAQQHIQLYIIEMAKQQLTASNRTISEIAYALGFEHPQTFSAFFKSKTQQSPGFYRKSIFGRVID